MRYPIMVFVLFMLIFICSDVLYIVPSHYDVLPDVQQCGSCQSCTSSCSNMGSNRGVSSPLPNTSLTDSKRTIRTVLPPPTAVHNGTAVAIMRERGQCRLLPRGSPSGTVEICLERERRRGCRGVVKVTISDCLLKFKGGMISKNVTLSEELKSLG
eukprot:Tbor_TRINITY_DN5463_c1_g3::TRINITY_DN5463_c1_g3_i3::g.25056::m.25056